MSKIENFINQHRDDFDDQEPSNEVWERIDSSLAKPQTKSVKMIPLARLWQVAAVMAGILICVTVVQAYYYGGFAQHDRVENMITTTITLEQISPELAEAEQYYVSQISEMRKTLVSYNSQKYGLDKDFEKDLTELENNYQTLKDELYKEGNLVVSDAMIQNLQQRMEILNQQLEILNQLKTEQGEKSNEI